MQKNDTKEVSILERHHLLYTLVGHDGVEQRTVLHASRHRAVRRNGAVDLNPTGARYPSAGGLEADAATEGGRDADRAAAVRT